MARSTAALRAERPMPRLPSAGDKYYRRLRAVLEFIYLALKLGGDILLDVDDRNVLPVMGERAKYRLCLSAVGDRICLQSQRGEAHNGVAPSDYSNFKHKDHAAFPVWSPSEVRRASR